MRYALILLALFSAGVAVQVIVQAAMAAVDLGRPVRYTLDALSLLLRDWGIKFVAVLSMPLGALEPDPTREPLADSTRPPVILVPGYGMNRSCFLFFAFYLKKRGFPWVWIVNNRPHSAGIPVYAQRLADAVRRMQSASGAARVDIIGHSAGGVIAAWYVNNLGGAAHVRRLVTVGTPWRGTRVAVFGMRAHARDLLPDTPVIRQIQRPAVPTFALWTETDGVLIPHTSGRAEGMSAIEVRGETHLSMLYSPTVWRRVRELLLASEPSGAQAREPQPVEPQPVEPTPLESA